MMLQSVLVPSQGLAMHALQLNDELQVLLHSHCGLGRVGLVRGCWRPWRASNMPTTIGSDSHHSQVVSGCRALFGHQWARCRTAGVAQRIENAVTGTLIKSIEEFCCWIYEWHSMAWFLFTCSFSLRPKLLVGSWMWLALSGQRVRYVEWILGDAFPCCVLYPQKLERFVFLV